MSIDMTQTVVGSPGLGRVWVTESKARKSLLFELCHPITYTAASYQVVIETLWLHSWGAVMSFILIYSVLLQEQRAGHGYLVSEVGYIWTRKVDANQSRWNSKRFKCDFDFLD